MALKRGLIPLRRNCAGNSRWGITRRSATIDEGKNETRKKRTRACFKVPREKL